MLNMCIFCSICYQIGLTLEAEELLPVFIRRQFVTRTRVVYPNRTLGPWGRFRQDVWGAERWDSVDNIRKHTQIEVVSIAAME